MNLFGSTDSNDNSNCPNHHWGEYEEDWDSVETQVKPGRIEFENRRSSGCIRTATIYVPRFRHCQHEGCSAKDRHQNPNRYQIPMELLSQQLSEMRTIEHLTKFLRGEHGEEIGYAILHRAQDIHDNDDDEFEFVAERLKELSNEILDMTGE